MSEIDNRLKEATANCMTCHDAWSKNQKDTAARDALMDAIHELRKVAARLEIEVAVSERDEMASKPIPIPSHRASRRKGGQQGGDDFKGNQKDGNDNAGNRGDDSGNGNGHGNGGNGGGQKGGPVVSRSRRPRRKAGGEGGGE